MVSDYNIVLFAEGLMCAFGLQCGQERPCSGLSVACVSPWAKETKGPMDTAPLLGELALDPEFFAQMTLGPLTLAMQALPCAALYP